MPSEKRETLPLMFLEIFLRRRWSLSSFCRRQLELFHAQKSSADQQADQLDKLARRCVRINPSGLAAFPIEIMHGLRTVASHKQIAHPRLHFAVHQERIIVGEGEILRGEIRLQCGGGRLVLYVAR